MNVQRTRLSNLSAYNSPRWVKVPLKLIKKLRTVANNDEQTITNKQQGTNKQRTIHEKQTATNNIKQINDRL